MNRLTIEQILTLKEKEDHVEFKEAKNSFSFEGGSNTDFKKRRKCVLGYIVALSNEGGGYLIFGIKENTPKHVVVGTKFYKNEEGALSQRIYEKIKVRVEVYALKDFEEKRVLIIEIPSRPIGKVFAFEDIPLMRVGDQLLRMEDSQYFKILSEQEPDFSSTMCDGATLDDLDERAIQYMKEAYSGKQNNSNFVDLDNTQVLSDLGLINRSSVTYAALILLGKIESIRKYLPQATIRLEYRNKKGQIIFDKRDLFESGYFNIIDAIWHTIDVRNGSIPVQKGSFIFDIPYFNYEVIREAINNAVAHRNYRLSSETVLKLYHSDFTIVSPGGFPKGVNIDNLITVSSTPRNRLLADVLSKTGAVERSGQGVDKIYYQSLSEAKGAPDYSKSDDFQVELRLSGIVKDKAFAVFIKEIQKNKDTYDRLSVQDIITLDKIRLGIPRKDLEVVIVEKLLRLGSIEKRGKTNGQILRLSKIYYEFTDNKGKYTAEQPLEPTEAGILIQRHLVTFKKAKMREFKQLLDKHYSHNQVKYLVYKLLEIGFLESHGKGSGTFYTIGKSAKDSQKLFSRAIELGFQQMIENGELNEGENSL